jgi:DNA-binding MarR family transcriptional regulator
VAAANRDRLEQRGTPPRLTITPADGQPDGQPDGGPGYDDPGQLADLLHGLTRRLRRAQAEQLAPLGLTPAQERALRALARSEEPLRMTELADRLGIVPRSLTTVIDALEEDGLVRREIDPRNRRAILLHLTERGAAVRDDLREARRLAAEALFAPLSEDDRKTLAGLLLALE